MSTTQALRKGVELDPLGGYIAGDFKKFEHILHLKDLKTGELSRLEFPNQKQVQALMIPAGKYAIVKITAYKRSFFRDDIKYSIELPYDLMKVLYVEPGKILYLGEFDYNIKKGLNLFSSDGSMVMSMDIEKAFIDINQIYKFEKPIEIVPF